MSRLPKVLLLDADGVLMLNDRPYSHQHAEDNIDQTLLAIARQLRSRGIKVYLATDQEKYRTKYMREVMFPDQLDGMFVSCELGYLKKQPEYFRLVLDKLPGIDPKDVLFFDDSQDKIDSARAAGINAELYFDHRQIERLLE